MSWVVLKFGGTSVQNRNRWDKIRSIIEQRRAEGDKILIVCSAKTGISNLLEKLLTASLSGDYKKILDDIIKSHHDLALDLSISHCETLLGEEFNKLSRYALGLSLLNTCPPRIHAEVMALGELMLSKLGRVFLEKQGIPAYWLDARLVLKAEERSDNNLERAYLSATCKALYDENFIEFLENTKVPVVLTQGFIASNAKEHTVLLGRGGSDTSASYFGAQLGAKRVEIWTDVPGMFTSNPQTIPTAKLLKSLHYDEAQELASAGAKVLHPRCIEPLKYAGIPIWIKWTEHPTFDGTIISDKLQEADAQLKAVVSRSNILMISMDTMGMWQEVGFLSDIFSCFKKHGLSIDLISTSQSNVTVTLDVAATLVHDESLERLFSDLKNFCLPEKKGPCTAISLVGNKIRSQLHHLTGALEKFSDKPVYMISQSASDLNCTFLVDATDAGVILRDVHKKFFQDNNDPSLFGPSWNDLSQPYSSKDHSSKTMPWWENKRTLLLDRFKEQTPVYCYDTEVLCRKIEELKAIEAIDSIHYAMKANAHPDVLALFAQKNLGFDCVSINELEFLHRQLPDLDSKRIVFTPNFAPISEYSQALAMGVLVTIDNAELLFRFPEVFKNQSIMLRLDPGYGQGHHRFVQTGGQQSKFGIALSELEALKAKILELNIRIVGLHTHVGSGILEGSAWVENAILLNEICENHFPQAQVVNLGGGLGVPYQPGQKALPLQEIKEQLLAVKKRYAHRKFWLEPGRFLVAESGVLLTSVTQIKHKGKKTFVGVDTGMNSLIRQPLYGSYHEIINLSKWGQPTQITCDIVGPICESGDVLGYDRKLPQTDIGDILLIDTAGAYGHVMASRYNLREPAREVILG